MRAIASGELDPADPTLQELPRPPRARILELAYETLRYEFLAGKVGEDESRGLSRRILVARSRVGRVPPGEDLAAIEIEAPKVRPDQGHESALLAVSGGWRDDEPFVELRWRPALHGFMDNGGGYPEHMQIRFLDTRLRINPDSGRVRLQELTLVELGSLGPRSLLFRT